MFERREKFLSLTPPLLRQLRFYDRKAFLGDLQAGVTVAIFAVPQVMAYAMLAGMAPMQGLHAALVMSVVAALWGSSPYVNSGPTNSSALLTAAAMLAVARVGNPAVMLFALTLLVGVFRIAAGGFRLGWVIQFVPASAFQGFTVGAGLLIALGQLHHLLGVAAATSRWFPARIVDTLMRLPEAHLTPILLGLGCLAVMLAMDRYSKRWPVALLAMAGAIGVSRWLGTDSGLLLVRDLAPLSGALPYPEAAAVRPEHFISLVVPALAIAAIGLIEAVSIGEYLAVKNRQSLNINQEFFAQGLSQIVAAFFHGFPGSGSFTRSALIEQTGGRTAAANVVFSLALLAAALACPGILGQIPVAALAGLLLYVGVKLVDINRIRRIVRIARGDAVVMAVTLLVTVLIRIEYGLFAGVLLGLLLYLRRANMLRVLELVPNADAYGEVPYEREDTHTRSDVVAASIHGHLFFGVAQSLRETLGEIAVRQRPCHLILRLRRVESIDYTCWNALLEFAEAFREQGGELYLCGVRNDIAQLVNGAGRPEVLPAGNLYTHTPVPFQSLDQAVRRVLSELPPGAELSPAWRTRAQQFPPLQSSSQPQEKTRA